MKKTRTHSNTAVKRKIARLQAELDEANDTILAIRTGQIDALVVNDPSGDRIFTLTSADQPYRVLVETMSEGALTLDKQGTVFYCNSCFADFVGTPLEEIIGNSITKFISKQDRQKFTHLLDLAQEGSSKSEMKLKRADRSLVPMIFSMSRVELEIGAGVCLVVTDISEQRRLRKSKKAVEALRVSNEKVKTALFARDEFLSVASHELKTPITSLKLQLAMAIRRINLNAGAVPDTSKLMKVFDISLKQVDRLADLIEDLLDVSKIQAGRVQYNFSEMNLADLLEEMTTRFSDQFELSRNKIRLDVSKDIIGVWDRSRLEQVFVNLITKALKYAPGTLIEIQAFESGDMITVKFSDHGFGVPKEKQNLIFDRFERATSSKNISGLGLGLFIVKRIIESHGGSISFEDTPGQGATFIIALPRTPKVQPAVFPQVITASG
jgi:PAS domain S-box-containing protein